VRDEPQLRSDDLHQDPDAAVIDLPLYYIVPLSQTKFFLLFPEIFWSSKK
jgi:hypothetical protein